MKLKKVKVTTLSANYQTYVPVDVQKKLKLHPSVKLEWIIELNGDVTIKRALSEKEKVMGYFQSGVNSDAQKTLDWLKNERSKGWRE